MNIVTETKPQDAQLIGDASLSLPLDEARPSWQTRFIVGLVRALGVKRRMASAEAVREHVRKLTMRPASFEPSGIGRGVDITRRDEAGWPVFHTAPSGYSEPSNYVVFLHGGGFVNEIVRAHWRFVGHLTRTANVRCIVPIYPLAPRVTAEDIVPATGELLRRIVEDAGSAKVTVVGNSAGAGLGIAATQWLRDGGHRQPDRLILISAGGDYSISRPEQVAIAAIDPFNDIAGARETGRLYAGDLNVSHPYVSPLKGNFHGIAPLLLFSGTLDLFYPDCIELAAKAKEAGVPVELHLRNGQPHNYAALPTPEGREAREIIVEAVR